MFEVVVGVAGIVSAFVGVAHLIILMKSSLKTVREEKPPSGEPSADKFD